MNLWFELSYTIRVVRKKLGFSFLCVLVITLGYLITLPLYSFVKNLAYTTLPYPEGDRLVILKQTDPRDNSEIGERNFDSFLFNVIQARTTSFEKLGAYSELVTNLSDSEGTVQITGNRITSEALGFAATAPILGRSLQAADELPGAERVALISYQVWQNYYGADANIVGRVARISAQPHTIIGVMPAGFRYPSRADIWLPLAIPVASEPGTLGALSIAGVLQEGISQSQASTELQLIMQGLSNDEPEFYENRSAKAVPFTQSGVNNGEGFTRILAGVAICLFLVICTNVGNLLIVRANERVKELAIRSAMGARRISLILHVLLESFLVCLCGAVLGILMSGWLLNSMQAFMFNSLLFSLAAPFWWDFSFDRVTLTISASMMLILWLFSGLFAAWRASRDDLASVLGSDAQSVVSERGGRVIRGLVLIQMQLSFFLLVLSGVLLFSFQGLLPSSVVAGAENYVTASIRLSTANYADASQSDQYRAQLRQRLLQRNELGEIAFATASPGGASSSVRIDHADSAVTPQQAPRHGVNWIDADYFETIDFPLLAGRYFDSSDRADSNGVVIVDEDFASRMSMDGSILGRQLQLYDLNGNPADQVTIVGVVPVSSESGGEALLLVPSIIYRPLTQQQAVSNVTLIAKRNPDIAMPVAELERLVRQDASAVDRDIPLYNFLPMSTLVETNRGLIKMVMTMFGAAAVGALLLAVISIYGLVSRSVYSRAPEIGIRRAIGSPDRDISRLFLSQGFFYLLAAIIFGGGAAVLLVNALNSSLQSISSAFNTLQLLAFVFPSVTVIVTALVFFASYMPVRKVVAMEPGEALHYE